MVKANTDETHEPAAEQSSQTPPPTTYSIILRFLLRMLSHHKRRPCGACGSPTRRFHVMKQVAAGVLVFDCTTYIECTSNFCERRARFPDKGNSRRTIKGLHLFWFLWVQQYYPTVTVIWKMK